MLLQLTVCVLALIQLTLSETTFTCVQQEAGEVVDTQQKFSELMALSSQLQDAVSQLQTAVSQLQKDNSRLMAALAVSPAEGRPVFFGKFFVRFYSLSQSKNLLL